MAYSTPDIFSRTERLAGKEALERLSDVKVLIVGTGGVGSWCAESLVRSGITQLTIADSDVVCASNVNRQLMATARTIGIPKVNALRERLSDINPDACITALYERFSEDTASLFRLEEYDYIVDAIDSIPDKMTLILKSLETGAVLFSSMGAALKTDPSRISVAEFWKVHGCPLAKALRTGFKKSGRFPSRKFQCVFSDERLENRPSADESGNGVAVHITASFGFRIASLVFNDVTGLAGH
ncbi:MAG: tRNA threonylcarbamoyladenosine dehydratase [Bacteroidaceae bacterium]|nr:tRNA threonylcarbamoyladenosine dehydratase [Bacteroidaceae bacterium]